MAKLKTKKIAIIASVLIILAIIILFYVRVTKPYVVVLSSELAKSEVVNAINEANLLLEKMDKYYDDYFTLKVDANNKVTAILANTGLINQVNMMMQIEIQKQLNELRNKKLEVPVGALSGNAFLAGLGSDINLHINYVSNCYTVITSNFKTEGINQTLHSLMITAYAEIVILTPLESYPSTIINEVLVAQNIIVGEVPTTYLGSNAPTDYLDLVP